MATLSIRQGNCVHTVHFTAPAPLWEVLRDAGVSIARPCGGRGVCGKCAVLLSGEESEISDAERAALAGQRSDADTGDAEMRLACQTYLAGDAEVILPDGEKKARIELSFASDMPQAADVPEDGKRRLGAAVDIGTTTLALALYDLSSGKCLAKRGLLNPQCAEAADVMGRIQAALTGKGATLQNEVTGALGSMLGEALREAGCAAPGRQDLPGPEDVDPAAAAEKTVIVGNTTMLYLLCGKDPVSLSHAPFEADDLFDRTENILGIPSYLPACMNAFVGADITAAVLHSGMCRKEETSLLCDIGTNGEIALWHKGTLFVTSTAAGPAFEGAGISCGMGSETGAVDRVWEEDGEIRLHTIGNAPAHGICGSGLLDAVAVLLGLERIDETGAAEEEDLVLGEGVCLLPKDIRAVQLAKGAIRAGIETVMKKAGITVKDVTSLYIAGGFGSHLDPASASAIGLIPPPLAERVVILGNAALAGASEMLLDGKAVSFSKEIAAKAVHVDLGGNPLFNELFVEHMLFEE